MASSSFKSISNHKWAYDVFVNFGGDNNVKSFVDHLFSDFKRKGIRAFRDDEKLHIGEDRSQQVYRAIEQSSYESKFIDMISKHIFNELNDGPLHVGVNLVGVHFRAEQMNLLHFAEASEVHMIGICGVWGIGKTSIAKAVYNRLYVHFEGCSFCEDIKGFVKMHGGMIQLQRQIIEDITKADMKIRSVGEGSSVMKRIMASKQVLVILDEIDQLDQLEALAGAHCWFGPGSLIVITGEDRQLLLGHGVEKIYDVELLNDDEAMELLSLYAFKQKHPKEDFTWLSKQVVQYVKGHPLALKVLGCFLFGKTVHEWESELDRLHRHHIDDMQGLISRYSSKKKQKVV
ncbi:TMV resistance protein N-like isoform X2 [Cynara cardunculus var. scolymus]|uniref:TMV resistance protein N-like isoform X2 n=1 Tax=Cynara cardunculus var. scolymus TaxID=59895 RepID=UPI000D627A9C|nr:TMV resistance protein N-like isoform X2 [Cynara cardunculus var. scolymus]